MNIKTITCVTGKLNQIDELNMYLGWKVKIDHKINHICMICR